MQRRMTNRTLLAVLLATIVLVTLSAARGAAAQERPIKIAVVNLDFVVAQSPAGKALQARLEELQTRIKAESESQQQEAADIQRRAADGANSLSEEKLAQLQQEYEDKVRMMRRYREEKQREGQKMQQEGLRGVEQQLEPIFERIRDAGGYDLILNNAPGVVVMASGRINITQKVLDELNAQ
jgi:outer membrane protein